MLAPWKKSNDKTGQYIKKQRHYYANKGPPCQVYGFSSNRAWLWELDYQESWALKNWCFTLWCWRRSARRFRQSTLRKSSPEYSLEGLMLKLQYFGCLMWRVNSLKKTLMLGKIKGRRRRGWQRMRWLDGITDSMDMSLSKLRKTVKDRKPWRGAVHEVAKNQIGLGDWTTTISEDTTFTKRAAKVGWMSLLHGTPNAVKRMLPN